MNSEEGEEMNCTGQYKCLISTRILFTQKQNPLTCVTKQYRCSWQTWSYSQSCYWSASVLKNSGSSAVVDNSTSGGLFTAALTALIPSELKTRTTSAYHRWYEPPYLFMPMLLVIWREVMVHFFLGTVKWKRHLQTSVYVQVCPHACMC